MIALLLLFPAALFAVLVAMGSVERWLETDGEERPVVELLPDDRAQLHTRTSPEIG